MAIDDYGGLNQKLKVIIMCTIWCNGLCDGGCGEGRYDKSKMRMRVFSFDFSDGRLNIKEENEED